MKKQRRGGKKVDIVGEVLINELSSERKLKGNLLL